MVELRIGIHREGLGDHASGARAVLGVDLLTEAAGFGGIAIHMDVVRQRLGLMITALDIRYDTKCDHALAGRRVPDVDLTIADSETRVPRLLQGGRPVLLVLKGSEVPSVDEWADRIDVVTVESRTARWVIPGVGDIVTPSAVFLRPDGYVARAADEADAPGLTEALTTWVGAPA